MLKNVLMIDATRFEKPIKKNRLQTECGKHKINKDGKTVSACLMRDLFGSVLHLSLERSRYG